MPPALRGREETSTEELVRFSSYVGLYSEMSRSTYLGGGVGVTNYCLCRRIIVVVVVVSCVVVAIGHPGPALELLAPDR